jgi:hypothetical protein
MRDISRLRDGNEDAQEIAFKRRIHGAIAFPDTCHYRYSFVKCLWLCLALRRRKGAWHDDSEDVAGNMGALSPGKGGTGGAAAARRARGQAPAARCRADADGWGTL